MFAPTKTWRKWHRRVNTTPKRYAVTSTLAASAIPTLVMPRGHHIDEVPEDPLVLSNNAQGVTKTSAVKDVLAVMVATDDIIKAAKSKKIWDSKSKRCAVIITYPTAVRWYHTYPTMEFNVPSVTSM